MLAQASPSQNCQSPINHVGGSRSLDEAFDSKYDRVPVLQASVAEIWEENLSTLCSGTRTSVRPGLLQVVGGPAFLIGSQRTRSSTAFGFQG